MAAVSEAYFATYDFCSEGVTLREVLALTVTIHLVYNVIKYFEKMIIFLDIGSQPFKQLFDHFGAAGTVISFELASCFDYFLNTKCHGTVP